MVEIVSTKPHQSAIKEIVCVKGCGSTLSYVPNDVQERHGKDYGGGPDGAEWIVCPVCDKNVIIRSL